MNHVATRSANRSRSLLLALFGLAVMALLAPAVGSAAVQKKEPKVSVMTRNLYLGADLGPALEAKSICDAVDAGGTIINQVDLSNFPERSKLLAAEIARAKPSLVGLQEVALWRDQTPSDYATTPATHVRYDFLQLLQDQLKASGAKYKVVVSQDEFDQELPADIDGKNNTGSGPFGTDPGPLQCGADIDGRLTMRDVILVKKGSNVKVSNPQMGHFTNLFQVKLAGILDIAVTRGWVSVDGKIKSTEKTRGAKFRFVNAHLEAFGDPAIREAQAREMFAPGGPLVTKKQLIFVGDINSGGPKDRVGTGFTTPGDEGAYNAFTQDFGLKNMGTRQTCCYPDVFASAIGSYRFDHTVDHIFAKPKMSLIRSFVTGNDPTVTGAGGVVASDHGGLYAKLQFK